MASNPSNAPILERLDQNSGHCFSIPAKRINDGDDVTFFLASRAYADIMTFIFQLNTSMIPRKTKDQEKGTESIKEWKMNDPDVSHPHAVQSLAKLLAALANIIDEAPPDPGPRRFGNVSFRMWYDIVRERVPGLLDTFLPKEVLSFKSSSDVTAKGELEAYLIGSFGSSQRLDYGTGHELSFLAFLGCLWKLGAFPESQDGDQERGIVLGVIEPYLVLIRRLILTYTLEPAGSHGVWGLDDHSFLPYVFGSAQFSPAIVTPADVAAEGSLPNAPNPTDVAKAPAVERERTRNMYFSAIGFIYDVKKGPFWEHSNILYDVSGVKAGWAKINKVSLSLYITCSTQVGRHVADYFPGNDKNVQRRSPLQIPSSSTLPLRLPLLLHRRPARESHSALFAHIFSAKSCHALLHSTNSKTNASTTVGFAGTRWYANHSRTMGEASTIVAKSVDFTSTRRYTKHNYAMGETSAITSRSASRPLKYKRARRDASNVCTLGDCTC
jgi:hypothetical protein